jgi:predicted esterase
MSTRSFVSHGSIIVFLLCGCTYSPPIPLSRADVLRSLQRFDKAFLAATLDDSTRSTTNAAFDNATFPIAFNLFSDAARGINNVWTNLAGGPATQPPQLVLISLKVAIDARVGVAGQSPPTARIVSLYPGAFPPTTLPIQLRVRSEDGTLLSQRDLSLAITADTRIDQQTPLLADDVSLPAGLYSLELASGDTIEPAGRFSVLPAAMATIRAANEAKLAAITAATPALDQALASARQRNSLLVDRPTGDRLYELLVDPFTLVNQLDVEITALQGGIDPYINHTGDYWRVLHTDAADIPLRVYLSPDADLSKPLNLVVAFHGSGGDENVLVEAYGAGIIKSLAEQRGFLLVAPVTDFFVDKPAVFDSLLQALRYDYNIDPAHIYVVGHSLGAHYAAALAASRIGTLTAACGIAGGQDFSAPSALAPLFIIAGGADTLQPAERLRAVFDRASAKGLPVEFLVKPGLGHTLVVGSGMGDAVDWLLRH